MPKEHKPKSPVSHHTNQQQPQLPASVEQSYREKCKEIKKRIVEIESSNDLLTSRIQRARRAIQRMRLERAFLLQQLEARTDVRVDDSEGSPSPPPTPSQKPLRVKRPRKDPPANDSPMRQTSGSPPPTRDTPEYSFVNATFGTSGSGKAVQKGGYYNNSNRGRGPKRPPNAYMIFCERERDSIKERESGTEGFDMHKALAQAWRDLKQEGQKPYFDEYERQLSAYNKNKGEARDAAQHAVAQSKRATSATSSLPAGSTYDGAQSPAMGSANEDDAEDTKDNMSELAFQASNK